MRSERGQAGPVTLTSILVLIALIVAGIWTWKSLDYDTQDFVTEVVMPLVLQGLLVLTAVWLIVRKIRARRALRRRIARLIATFQAEPARDKQHRIRGMAASSLGAIEDRAAIPMLMEALEDDHAYVRGCAALALGRMRAAEAKEKLGVVMKEDWDQTVRSRAREAFERLA